MYGQRAWRSSAPPSCPEEHCVFPQEVGYIHQHTTLTRVRHTHSDPLFEVGGGGGGRGGELVVEFTALYHPASIDVFIGTVTYVLVVILL